MTKEKVLVVGLGEVGRTLYELLKECGKFLVYGFDIDDAKMDSITQESIPDKIDVIHICLRCKSQNKFVSVVLNYVEQFKPKLLIVNSTVPPGTTQKIHGRCSCLIAHSPVRGVHKSLANMKWELKRWTKYVGGADSSSGEAARRHFEKAGFRTKILKNSAETELAKLFETSYRAWMIACFQEMHRIARHFEADFDMIVDFLEDTHRVRLDRPVMFPSAIGGHCLIQNIELLKKSYDSEFLRLILKSNKKREEEIKDKNVWNEIERIKKRAEILEKELVERRIQT